MCKPEMSCPMLPCCLVGLKWRTWPLLMSADLHGWHTKRDSVNVCLCEKQHLLPHLLGLICVKADVAMPDDQPFHKVSCIHSY